MNKQNWPFTNPVDPNIYSERKDWPKISIVTPSYNQGQFIEETILSILNQNYPNLEYIIIDGGSTDNTVSIIKKYEDRINYWITEKDGGQTEAINKGFEKCTGNIFAYLNSDDCYYPNTLLEVANSYLSTDEPKVLIVGNCYWGSNFRDLGGWLDKATFPNTLVQAIKKRGLAPQPSMFWTNPLKLKFNEDLRFCMDFDFWLKLIVNNYSIRHSNKVFSLFRIHSESKTSTLNQIQEEELNAVSGLYKKFLNDRENVEITSFLLKQNQIELYSKLLISSKKNKISKVEVFKTVYDAKLPVRLKLKLFIKTLSCLIH